MIDVGTNSVRVLCADGGNDLLRDLRVTRLGQGVDRTGHFAAEALDRTVAAIEDAVGRCRGLDAERIRIFATSAVRDAADRETFLSRVAEQTGLTPDVLSGEQEARYGFAGARVGLDPAREVVVLDIGGGSTELVRGRGAVERFISMDIGSVRLTERHFAHDPPTPSEQEAVRADAAASIATGMAAIGSHRPDVLVGLAGTITTVAAIAIGLQGYDRDAIHHSTLSREQVLQIRARLAGMTSNERRALPAMPAGREDVIVAGIVILEQVLEALGTDDVLVSESDILDGVASDLSGT